MKRGLLAGFLCVMVVVVSGCQSDPYMIPKGSGMPVEAVRVDSSRMLIWRASLTLEVDTVKAAVARVTEITEASGGYVESKSDFGDTDASLTIRVPAGSLTSTMTSLEALGEVTYRKLSSDDVTETYVDVEARLATMVALRDRLRGLLNKAEGVTDILAIEKELGRIQGDIDSLQARRKSLKGQVDLATITVDIERKKILGPLGLVLGGVGWAIEKLFVIQD